ncbi:MAG: asparaginase domain-containing protein, partial [Bacillota bacterium]|nr:asparaginase domain-containing protein [Bacillota bacterium]
MNNVLPLVKIVATGGTIAGRGDNPLQTMGYRAGQLGIEEITDTIPGLSSYARIEGEQFVNLPSSALVPEDWL